MPTQILIVDDHPSARMGLAAFISTEPSMSVCGEAADVTQAMRMLVACRPGIVVVDIQLPTGNGLELVERIRAHDHNVGVLVWSFHADRLFAQQALSAGASGCLSKSVPASRILDAIRCVRDGRIFLSEDMVE